MQQEGRSLGRKIEQVGDNLNSWKELRCDCKPVRHVEGCLGFLFSRVWDSLFNIRGCFSLFGSYSGLVALVEIATSITRPLIHVPGALTIGSEVKSITELLGSLAERRGGEAFHWVREWSMTSGESVKIGESRVPPAFGIRRMPGHVFVWRVDRYPTDLLAHMAVRGSSWGLGFDSQGRRVVRVLVLYVCKATGRPLFSSDPTAWFLSSWWGAPANL